MRKNMILKNTGHWWFVIEYEPNTKVTFDESAKELFIE